MLTLISQLLASTLSYAAAVAVSRSLPDFYEARETASSAAAAKAANAIGKAYKAGEMGFLAHKVVHASAAAALGAGSMAVLGNRDQIFTAAASAAASAVAAECVAEGLDAGLGDTWPRRTLGTAAIFAGAFTGWATGDANAAALAALNAIQNNYETDVPTCTKTLAIGTSEEDFVGEVRIL